MEDRMRIDQGWPVPIPDRTYDVPDADPAEEQAEETAERLHRQSRADREET